MDKEHKLCLWCKHLEFENGKTLSEVTWDSGILYCTKGMWDLISDNPFDDDCIAAHHLYDLLHKAKDCKEFILKDSLIGIDNVAQTKEIQTKPMDQNIHPGS